MAIVLDLDAASEKKMYSSLAPAVFPLGTGPNFYFGGPFCQISTAGTAIASSTVETSLITGATTTGFGTAPTIVSMGNQPGSESSISGSYRIPAGFLQKGTRVYWDLVGTIANTATPNLTITAGLQNVTTGTYTALATTGIVAMVNLASAGVLHITGDFVPTVVSSSGTILSWVKAEYGGAAAACVPVIGALTSTGSFDFTADYYFDIRLTWGSSNSLNTAAMKYLTIGVMA